MIKILSIDWDYYIDADANTRHTCFPDGHDFSSFSLGNIVWGTRYAENAEFYERIGVVEDYEHLCRYFSSLDKAPFELMVTTSHIDAYNFLNSFIKGNKAFEITNIDFHHDAYPCRKEHQRNSTMQQKICSRNGKSVDCGNWLTAVLQERRNAEVRWVAREDSDTEFAMADKEASKRIRIITHEEALMDSYGAIFICRSDMWSCPHLDEKFRELWEIPNRKGFEILLNNRLNEDRWWNIKKEAKAHKMALQKTLSR